MLSFPVRARRGALAAVLVASALHANAQQTAASGSLEEIVVTAQKRREQNSQDIGISLSAVSGADLSSLGAVTATDITKSMPAVVLTQPSGAGGAADAENGNDWAIRGQLLFKLPSNPTNSSPWLTSTTA
jgi:outer membrane receptor protein involved in Fe transport